MLIEQLGYPVKRDELSKNIVAIQRTGGEILIAEVDNEPVGSICVLMDARLAEGIYAEIVSLVVAKKVRGKGIGKALIHEAEIWASNRVDKVRVRANAKRSGAHAFYVKQGYEETKTQKIFIKKL